MHALFLLFACYGGGKTRIEFGFCAHTKEDGFSQRHMNARFVGFAD
jgi:hypothetical protein